MKNKSRRNIDSLPQVENHKITDKRSLKAILSFEHSKWDSERLCYIDTLNPCLLKLKYPSLVQNSSGSTMFHRNLLTEITSS
jgi:hypothetical protein